MCDYSLRHLKSRRASEQDVLTTHHFGSTSGFKGASDKASGDAATPVCVLPGAEIAFSQAVRVKSSQPRQAEVNGEIRTIGVPPQPAQRAATFIQVDKGHESRHHDALLFQDNTIVLLNDLESGQDAKIISMPAAPTTEVERQQQERAAFV